MALLEITGIRKAFGGLLALDNVNFDVRKGEIKAVIGPNGAGKTTLFNVISGVLEADEGQVVFRDHDLNGMSPHRISAAGISRTFQNPSLFANMSAIENVMVGRHLGSRAGVVECALRTPRQRREERAIREEAMKYLEFCGLSGVSDTPVGSLSFGRRRMVELARAMATEPALLLLDEPASGLNTRETDDLSETIKRIRDRGVTVLLVEHDMSLVMNISDSVLVLDFGTPIAEGTPAQVRNNSDVIKIYLGGDFTDASS